MYDLKILAERLKATRTANNLTQRQLADKAKMTAATISAYEKGAKNPSLENVANLAFALNTSIDWLCGNDVDNCNPETYSDIITGLLALIKNTPYSIDKVEDEESDNENEIFYADIRLRDKNFISFFDDFRKMKNLIDEKTIDENIFNSWLDGQIKKYSIPLNKKDVDNGNNK